MLCVHRATDIPCSKEFTALKEDRRERRIRKLPAQLGGWAGNSPVVHQLIPKASCNSWATTVSWSWFRHKRRRRPQLKYRHLRRWMIDRREDTGFSLSICKSHCRVSGIWREGLKGGKDTALLLTLEKINWAWKLMAKHLSLWPVFSLSKKRAGPSTEPFLLCKISHSCPKPGRAPLAVCFFSLTDTLFPTGFDEKRCIQVKAK